MIDMAELVDQAVLKNPQSEQRFVVGHVSEILKPFPPMVWLINGMVHEQDVITLYGKPGCKKTWVSLWLGFCVAAGIPFLGHETLKKNVLIVDEESGQRRLLTRMKEICSGNYFDAKTLPLFYTTLNGLDLCHNSNDANKLEEVIQEKGIGFCVVDALIEVLSGESDNNSENVNPVYLRLRVIAKNTGCSFLVIHHSGKNQAAGARGSNATDGASDLMLEVTSEPGSQFVEIRSSKTRDIEPFSFTARAVFEPGAFRMETAIAMESGGRGRTHVLNFLKEHTEATTTEITEAVKDCTSGTALKALKDLVKEGMVTRVNPGNKGTPAIYSLVKESPSQLGIGTPDRGGTIPYLSERVCTPKYLSDTLPNFEEPPEPEDWELEKCFNSLEGEENVGAQ